MTELETRLHADAARTARQPVPDLDAMLDRAMADDSQDEELGTERAVRERPSVRRIAPWLAAAAAVVALAAGVVAISTHESAPDRPSRPAAPTDLPSTRGDTVLTYQKQTDVDAVARVKGVPSALDVVLPYDTSAGGCSLFAPRVTVTSQTADRVVLVASGYRYLDRFTGNYSCTDTGTGTEVLKRVHLDAPIGNRTVLDGALGGNEAITGLIDPGAVPTPTYVPDGYSEFSADRVDLRAGGYTADRQYASGEDKFSVQGGPSKYVMGDGDSSSKADVNGVRGDFYADGCLYWSPRPGYTYGVCPDGPSPLSAAQLLAVARSVR